MTRTVERMGSFNRSVSFKPRGSNLGSPRFSRKNWVKKLFRVLIVIGSVVTFLLAISGGYLYVLPSFTQAFHEFSDTETAFNGSNSECDIYDGNWVVDNSYPLYIASECPFVEQGFNCLANGRTDGDYIRWKWRPRSCGIPRYHVHSTLEMLRNKRVVFVGDSMSRTQWESLICLLMTGVQDKSSVFEVNGNKITKLIRFLGVRFSSFNFSIEFYRSVYLVQHNWSAKYGPRRVRSTLKLDKMDAISHEWTNADILIFNSGQWWVPGKLFGTGCYFQVGNTIRLGMSIPMAFRTALQTWASWVDANINPNRTRVFFRTYEPSHWRNLTLRQCYVPNQPLSETGGQEYSSFSDAILNVVKSMIVPVTVLHITPMAAFRSDAHVGTWSDNPSLSDCSHWCLPGVPDVWNEIVLSYLHATYRSTLRERMLSNTTIAR
ncbi:PREDICTED: protein trichome berefringence-like 7 [Ipomoea nil]|uniref:protein trichome berefringence-like 7 n=1 Tax=Ipomoea nil TaxID=35883 RepID=UPI0009010D7B|nr:PREDICTED: protein trichome berefringence-like 7 [Ipomoea nil]XP_019177151.1 PREDICTED: protein trichome berefringence-like 7 [Ipomoea nil]